MKQEKLNLGQTLYFRSKENFRPSGAVTVVSVGRTWAWLSNRLRLNAVTRELDDQKYGYAKPGVIYNSEADYLLEKGSQTAYNHLADLIRANQRGNPSKLPTIERISKAAEILGLKMP